MVLLAVLSVAHAGPAAETVKIGDPYARASVTPSSAAFLTLTNTDTQAHALVSAVTPSARTVELHTMAAGADGTMQMRPIPRLELPAGATTALAPGGHHLMLIGLIGALTEGSVALTLTFEDGTTAEVDAPVRR